MIIRAATPSDLTAILKLAYAFYQESPYSKLVDYNEDSVAATILGAGISLVAEDRKQIVGMCVCLVVPMWVDPSKTLVSELLWYIHPDHRGGGTGTLLREAAEHVAVESGANFMGLTSLGPDIPLDDTYTLAEKTYLKGL